MSIISEALKKAEKQAQINLKTPSVGVGLPEKSKEYPPHKEVMVSKNLKEYKFFLTLALSGIIISLAVLGSIAFLKNLNQPKDDFEIHRLSSSEENPTDNFLKKSDLEVHNVPIELNGIVFESNERWAIINNKIVRVGDSVGDEKVVEIGKDYVRLTDELRNVERILNLR